MLVRTEFAVAVFLATMGVFGPALRRMILATTIVAAARLRTAAALVGTLLVPMAILAGPAVALVEGAVVLGAWPILLRTQLRPARVDGHRQGRR